jgi:hypothetical protein
MLKHEIRKLTEPELTSWDIFVGDSSHDCLFYKTEWLRALGNRYTIYVYFKGGEIFAGIPISWSNRFGFKVALQPMPTPFLEILFKYQDSKYVQKLSKQREAVCHIDQKLRHDFDYIYFRLPPGTADLQPFIWKGYSVGIEYTYIIDLNKNLDEIWQEFDHTKRNRIINAQKKGISVIATDNFDSSFQIVEKTFRRQGIEINFKIPAQNCNRIALEAKQCKSFQAIDQSMNALAVTYLIWDDKKCYGLLGGHISEQGHNGAKSLAIWEAIKFSKNLGLKQFDFEGSMIPSIEQFIRKFGGTQTPYFTITWCRPYLKIPICFRTLIKSKFTRSAFFKY